MKFAAALAVTALLAGIGEAKTGHRAPLRGQHQQKKQAATSVTIDALTALPTTVPSAGGYKARVPTAGELPHQHAMSHRVDGRALEGQVQNRPSLIDYNPVANPGAVMIASDKMARFTVLTDRLIRMEYAKTSGGFTDYATIAMMNRNLPVPQFTAGEANGVLTITTSSVVLTYKVGSGGFNGNSLSVQPVAGSSSAFKGWSYGQPDTGNLLGTIRGLDGQNNTPLNCTQNAAILDNGEENHCEWGVVSKDGWAIYDDSSNFLLDENDWWVGTNNPNPPPRACNGGTNGADVQSSTRSSYYPQGTTTQSAGDCCARCLGAPDCVAWVWASDGSNSCWPLAGWAGTTSTSNRVFGTVTNSSSSGAQQNGDAMDLYGFFHGHDYFGALQDFVGVSGKAIMVPKYASGVWWSRWYDLNNQDLLNVIWGYGNRRIPLDVFVIDMDWHTKDNWSGFTFDPNLFPFPQDTMSYLKAMGLPVTLNIHDASGVNSWEAMFPKLISYLGLPSTSTVVPLNLVNATVAYAVEDIVMGDLVYNKNVSFFWIDWQQGGTAGGMTGSKQNPTIWLNHLRCTDRHRVGDDERAMVLARWGGMGNHRYQVGFSGDVAQLTWSNLAYQPYFSVTAANVAHGFWSHDIEGPGNDAEMFTRWLQVGTFSGVMRSHDRGMSAGGCANSNPFGCSVVEPWNAPNVNFPAAFIDANRQALTWRSYFLPAIYNGHRSAFDSGVGLLRPMYYHYPEQSNSYLMDANGNNVQYMFGPSALVSPVVTAGDSSVLAPAAGCATKTTWLPPNTVWVDANSGVITSIAPGDNNHQITKQFAINEIPLWYVGGSVVPYLPLRSLPNTIGNAARGYSALGFKIVPTTNSTAVNASVSVYEDDGHSTAYLTANAYAWTTASYSTSQGGMAMKITVSTSLAGPAFPELPATRSLYQFTLMNSAPVASVTANGVAVPFNRYGRAFSQGRAPASSSFHYAVDELPWGMGAVIDIVNVDTSQPLVIQIEFAEKVDATTMSGVYGAISHALWAKANTDTDRSTPGSENGNLQPAHMSILSSAGGALEYLAGTNTTAFVELVESIPSLLQMAINEVTPVSSPRAPYAVSLLRSAMV